ncbi:hypothetical protein ACLB2K_006666 [Fragaria x ananassa]
MTELRRSVDRRLPAAFLLFRRVRGSGARPGRERRRWGSELGWRGGRWLAGRRQLAAGFQPRERELGELGEKKKKKKEKKEKGFGLGLLPTRAETMFQAIRLETIDLGSVSCSAETTKEYAPEVADEFKPAKNLEFRTLDKLYHFYNKYVFEAGFSVRKSSTAKSKDGYEIIRQELCCQKEGHSKKIKTHPKRQRGVIRTSCPAKITAVKKSSMYVDHKNSLLDFVIRFNRALLYQRHQELVATHIDMNEEPPLVKDLDGLQIIDSNALVVKRSNLFHHASLVIDRVLTSSDESQTMFIEALDSVLDRLNQMQVCSNENPTNSKKLPSDVQQRYNEPKKIKAKGSGKRLKKTKEQTKRKRNNTRKCHGCGLYGQSHDKRNCPALGTAKDIFDVEEEPMSTDEDEDSCSFDEDDDN